MSCVVALLNGVLFQRGGKSQFLILAVDECILDTWLLEEATVLYRIEVTFF